MGQIILEGLEFFAYHGYYEEEQKLGNKYTVDITITADFDLAARDDRLDDTINYEGVYDIAQSVMSDKIKLLEHIAHRINEELIESYRAIQVVETKVSKHNPPVKGICQKASVVLKQKR